jgi:hypothetical protein
MKFVTMFVVVLFAQNVFAQTSPVSLGEPGDAARDSCLTSYDQTQCCNEYGTCVQSLDENSEQCATVARLCGHQNLDAAMREGCQQRNAIVQGNECICASGLQWDNDNDKTCCTTNPATYERRRSACERSGGTYHCSSRGGWCGCPLGMSHPIDEDGHTDYRTCSGEAVNRERIQAMRDEIATMAAQAEEAGRQIAALQTEREILQGQLEQARANLALAEDLERQLEEIERSLDEMEREFVEMDAELSFLRNRRREYERHIERQALMIGELGGIPPAAPTPDNEPLPGTREAVAAAARDTGSDPLAPTTPPPEEGEETAWCNQGFGEVLLCYVLPAVAIGGLVVGSVCAAGYCDRPEGTIGFAYR